MIQEVQRTFGFLRITRHKFIPGISSPLSASHLTSTPGATHFWILD
jgi:hypothetical protein